MICTPNTGHPVLGVFLCDTVMLLKGLSRNLRLDMESSIMEKPERILFRQEIRSDWPCIWESMTGRTFVSSQSTEKNFLATSTSSAPGTKTRMVKTRLSLTFPMEAFSISTNPIFSASKLSLAKRINELLRQTSTWMERRLCNWVERIRHFHRHDRSSFGTSKNGRNGTKICQV